MGVEDLRRQPSMPVSPRCRGLQASVGAGSGFMLPSVTPACCCLMLLTPEAAWPVGFSCRP